MIFPQSGRNSAPLELRTLRYLKPRIKFSTAQYLNYKNLSKGFDGERNLQRILESKLSPNYLIVNNSLIRINQTEFQIDILLIGNNKIYPLEVKNYEGNFFIQDDNWYVVSSGNQIRNPVHQLNRSELLLRNFLKEAGFNFQIEPYIIFINPEFYLYQAPLDLPVIFPTQIKRFITKLNGISFQQTNHHKDLSKSLVDHQIQQSAYEQLPNYEYEELKKGLVCNSCYRYLSLINYKRVFCEK